MVRMKETAANLNVELTNCPITISKILGVIIKLSLWGQNIGSRTSIEVRFSAP